jgi:hypothetical protein
MTWDCSSTTTEETALAEPWLSTVTKLTEFFATEHIEASARRTQFVQRASKITGKLFLALVTLGRWSTPKTSVAQLAAKAAQLSYTPQLIMHLFSVPWPPQKRVVEGKMYRILLTPDEEQELEQTFKTTPDRRVRDRCQAVLMAARGRARRLIAQD